MKIFNVTLGSIVSILCLTPTKSQLESPCPGVFEYGLGTVQNANEVYGFVQASVPQDGSSVIKLEVQISVGNPVQGYTGKIELGATRAEIISDLTNNKPIRYFVYFPQWTSIPPRVTKIAVNQRTICTGSPVDRTMVSYVTTVNLQHVLTISGINGMPSQDNWKMLPNFSNVPTKPETDSNQKPSFYFVLGAPNMDQPSEFQYQNNPFFTPQGIPGTQPKTFFDPSVFQTSDTSFPSFLRNSLFGSTNSASDPPKTIQTNSASTKPDKPKAGEDRNIYTPPKNKQINNGFKTTESNLVTQTQSSADICGISVNSNNLLVRGERVARNLYPWLAALFLQNEQGLKFMCGTSLISRKHVLTAAHCVRNKLRKFNPEELWVVLGRENIQKWSNDGAQIIQADSTHYHPDHQFHTADADISVIVLSEEVTFTPSVRPVCLWSGNTDESLIVGQNGTVVGWGKDEQGRVFTPEPRKVTMPVVSEETCLRSNVGFREITSNRTFCAGNKDDSGPCNGDSGSGFLLKKRERWYIRGVVSMSLLGSDGSCDLKQYIVYTDVAKYVEWIKSLLSKN